MIRLVGKGGETAQASRHPLSLCRSRQFGERPGLVGWASPTMLDAAYAEAASSASVPAASEGVGRDDLAPRDRPQRPPGHPGDGRLDEADGAVAEQGVDAAGMITPRRDR